MIVSRRKNLKSFKVNFGRKTDYNSNTKWETAEKSISAVSNCVVVIPIYKNALNLGNFETKSIFNTIKILDKYEIVLLAPKRISIEEYCEKFNHNFSFLKVSDTYFTSRKSYSDLCETSNFYNEFSDYEYMLICQPDAWVFEDRLEYFINLGYDYIGAVHLLNSKGEHGRVGNGGFSLRKISKFKNVCEESDFSAFPRTTYEDCAFTIRLNKKFNIAPLEVGFDFGWQEHPEAAFLKTKKLPFGCHNPIRNNWNFWKDYISI